MTQELLFLLGNSLITYNLIVLLSKQVGSENRRLRKIVTIALVAGLIFAHYAYFIANKSESYYDFMQVPATAKPQQLKEAQQKLSVIYHPDKQKSGDNTLFIKLRQLSKVLKDSELRGIYDIFGEELKFENEKNMQLYLSSLQFKEYTMLIFFYAITLVITIVMTYDDAVRRARGPALLTIAFFTYLDLQLKVQLDDSSQLRQFNAVAFKYLAPFEISQFLRLLLSALLTAFRALAVASDEFSLDIIDNVLMQELQNGAKMLHSFKQNQGSNGKDISNWNLDHLQSVIAKNSADIKASETGILQRIRKILQKVLPYLFILLFAIGFLPLLLPNESKEL